jgi:hypothetical protein
VAGICCRLDVPLDAVFLPGYLESFRVFGFADAIFPGARRLLERHTNARLASGLLVGGSILSSGLWVVPTAEPPGIFDGPSVRAMLAWMRPLPSEPKPCPAPGRSPTGLPTGAISMEIRMRLTRHSVGVVRVNLAATDAVLDLCDTLHRAPACVGVPLGTWETEVP